VHHAIGWRWLIDFFSTQPADVTLIDNSIDDGLMSAIGRDYIPHTLSVFRSDKDDE